MTTTEAQRHRPTGELVIYRFADRTFDMEEVDGRAPDERDVTIAVGDLVVRRAVEQFLGGAVGGAAPAGRDLHLPGGLAVSVSMSALRVQGGREREAMMVWTVDGDHPAVGSDCAACGMPVRDGDAVTIVPLGPGADADDRAKCARGGWYSAWGVLAHAACAGVSPRPATEPATPPGHYERDPRD